MPMCRPMTARWLRNPALTLATPGRVRGTLELSRRRTRPAGCPYGWVSRAYRAAYLGVAYLRVGQPRADTSMDTAALDTRGSASTSFESISLVFGPREKTRRTSDNARADAAHLNSSTQLAP